MCPTGMQEGPAAGPIDAMVEARRELRPALRGGSAACGGRLRCVPICLSRYRKYVCLCVESLARAAAMPLSVPDSSISVLVTQTTNLELRMPM